MLPAEEKQPQIIELSRAKRGTSRIKIVLIATLLHGFLEALARTLRFTHLWRGKQFDEPCIFILWHNRQILMPWVYREAAGREVTKPVVVLHSEHGDGRIAGKVITKLGLRTEAGSSTRGGGRAFLRLLRVLKRGDNIAVTPDGPRGPLYELKEGVVRLAQHAGCPIYPLAITPRAFVGSRAGMA